MSLSGRGQARLRAKFCGLLDFERHVRVVWAAASGGEGRSRRRGAALAGGLFVFGKTGCDGEVLQFDFALHALGSLVLLC